MTRWTTIRINLRIPEEWKRKIHNEMKHLGFKTYAEYFRHLLREHLGSD